MYKSKKITFTVAFLKKAVSYEWMRFFQEREPYCFWHMLTIKFHDTFNTALHNFSLSMPIYVNKIWKVKKVLWRVYIYSLPLRQCSHLRSCLCLAMLYHICSSTRRYVYREQYSFFHYSIYLRLIAVFKNT